MSFQTYSREYLQSMPQRRKQEQIDTIIQGFIHDIHTAAAVGMKSYRYVRPVNDVLSSYPGLTDPEIVAGFFHRFPGCKVYYEDVWLDSARDIKILKKSIVIDWS